MIDRTLFLNCPRCELCLKRRSGRSMVEYCPRCMGRAGIPVRLFVSSQPSVAWHRDGPPPDATECKRTTVAPGVRETSLIGRSTTPIPSPGGE
jgi:hypothetical protein